MSLNQYGFACLAGACLGIVLAGNATAARYRGGEPVDVSHSKVIVCLGDSITDGQTYSLIFQQTLRKGGKPVPICIAAGIGGNTSADMVARLDRDVLRYNPDLVILNCGLNDIAKHVKTLDFDANVTHIAMRLRQANIPLMVLTLTTVRGVHYNYNHDDTTSLDSDVLTYDGANIILLRLAAQFNFPLADVSRIMAGAPPSKNLWEADGCHLSYEGFCYMTRAIVDAFGYPTLRIPQTYSALEVPLLPGVVRAWEIRPMAEHEAEPDAKGVAGIKIDDKWTAYALPETNSLVKTRGWWWDQERRQGFALSLKEHVGPAERYLCCAEIQAPGKAGFVNIGDGVKSVWLNGARVPIQNIVTGWHAGGQRIPMEFEPGTNRLVAVTGDHFFISVTDTDKF